MKLRFDEFLNKANGVMGSLAGIAFSFAVLVGSISFSKRHLKRLLSVKKEEVKGEVTVENKKPTSNKKSSSKTTTKAVDCSSETK